MTPEDIKNAARFSNLAQFFKMTIWERMEGNQLPEKALDEIAELIWERFEYDLSHQKAKELYKAEGARELAEKVKKDLLVIADQGEYEDLRREVERYFTNEDCDGLGYTECNNPKCRKCWPEEKPKPPQA